MSLLTDSVTMEGGEMVAHGWRALFMLPMVMVACAALWIVLLGSCIIVAIVMGAVEVVGWITVFGRWAYRLGRCES